MYMKCKLNMYMCVYINVLLNNLNFTSFIKEQFHGLGSGDDTYNKENLNTVVHKMKKE